MNTERQNSFEYFQHGSHRMLKDVNGRVIQISGGAVLEGYLTIDKQNGAHAQVCFVTSRDLAIQAAHVSLWRSFLKGCGDSVCPGVSEITDFDGLPCCISSLPAGEPINHFINRNGVIPAEVAVRLILEFVRSIQTHTPTFYRQFAIAAESIWIARTSVQPKIVLGNLSPVNHPNPEAHNAELCIELLKYLTGNPAKNKRFQGLLARLETCPPSFESLEGWLTGFAEANPSSNYWMGYNDPDSLVERIIAVEAANRHVQKRKEAAVQLVQRSIWPTVVIATLALGAFLTYCLIALPTESVARMVALQPQVEYRYVGPTQTSPEPIQTPAPKSIVALAPVAKWTSSTPSVNIVVPQPASRILISHTAEPRVSPAVKNLLAATGELFKEFTEVPKSEWLIHTESDKESKSGGADRFSLEDARNLKLLELKRAASEAKRLNRPFEGVKIEVALLKLKPDLIDSRIRLHDYLSQIQNMTIGVEEITDEEAEILVEASGENSKAREILNKHFSKNSKMDN